VPSWFVPRDAATARLDPDASLLVVHGPAGSGKSLLLARWVRDALPADRAVLWLDATAAPSGDDLWARALTALADAGLLAGSATDRARVDAARGGRGAGAAVVDVLHGLTAPVLVVVDGYEAVASASTDAELVRVLGRVDRLHVAVTTRRAAARLVAAGGLGLDVAEVGPADLRLGTTEVAAVLTRAGLVDAGPTDADPPGTAAARVADATAGLAVAVRAVALAASRGAVDLPTARHEELVDVAAQGVVLGLGTVTHDDVYLVAARRLSVAERLTPELAGALTGGPADELLARLEADGLGTWHDAPAELTLTPVIRAALRADLDRSAPGEVPGLLRTVVAWGLEAQRYYPALHAAAETGDLDLVTATVVRVWGSGQARDAGETIRVLEQLPRGAVARRPQLALLLALLHNTRAEHRVRALEWFALAAAAAVYHLPRATPPERALLRAGESVAMRLLGRGGRARTAALAALDHLAAAPPGTDPTVDALRGLLHRQLGVSLVAAGDVEHGIQVVESSLAHAPSGSLAAFSAHSLVAGFLAVQGDLGAARPVVEAAAALEPPRRPETAYRRSTLDLARVHLAVEAGDLDAAVELLDDLADELRTNEFWPAFAEVQATVDRLRGRAVPGEEALTQALRRGRRAPATAAWRGRLVASRALLALAGGQAERGLALLDPVPAAHPAARVARGRLLLSTGRHDDARALLAAPDLPDEGPGLRATRRFVLAAASVTAGTTAGTTAGADADAAPDHPQPHGGDRERRAAVALRALHEAAAVLAGGGSRTGWSLVSATERAALTDLVADDPELAALLADLAGVPTTVPDARAGVGLSERELVVLRALADGTELAEVAARLHVSHNTVKTQVRSAYRKLGVRTRADALSRARDRGLL
jgi:LuxR family maltose regulon positive regulatory protein